MNETYILKRLGEFILAMIAVFYCVQSTFRLLNSASTILSICGFGIGMYTIFLFVIWLRHFTKRIYKHLKNKK